MDSARIPPLLSIITVTKNCAPTIARALQSVREIKTPDIEYIVVDGVSTDGTLGILAKDKKKRKPNRGKKYILCCRSDVCWPNDKEIEVLVPRPFLLPFFNTIPHLSTFISTDIQKSFGYREDLKIASDYDLFLRLFLRGYRFRIADPITAIHYRGGVSGDIPRSDAEIERVKRDNLGVLYFVVRLLMQLNRLRKKSFAAGSR